MLDITIIIFLAMLDGSLQSESSGKNEFAKPTTGVGCYKCHSRNGSDAHCGDPFHPAYNMERYHTKCEQGQDNRIGLFPARYCTKIKGTNLRTNEEMIVRSCSMSALDNTCGLFQFENARYSGCLMSCTRDACNGGHSPHGRTAWTAWISLTAITLVSISIPGILSS